MAIQNIIEHPNSLLRKTSTRVIKFDAEFQTLVNDLIETMLQQDSMGLAAPQIGVLQRVFVLNRQRILGRKNQKYQPNDILCVANPEIKCKECLIDSPEGCLSIPQERGIAKRFERIQLKGVDRNGYPLSLRTDGMLSILIQHEIDHLDGILFIDRVIEEVEALF
ncbi:MAG: peptide deformylase [Mastigocoleus sp. MO_167.B18]|nr:peptide deformylase [Mastigocoleus sp. MO_167.B18]